MKKTAAFLAILVGLGLGFARWVDLLNYSDLATGFAAMGKTWWRYAAMAAFAALAGLVSLLAARRPRALLRRSWPMGLCALAAGLSWAAVCGYSFTNMAQLTLFEKILSGLYLLTALWLVLMAASRLTWRSGAPTGSAWVGVVGTLSFYLLTIYRFGIKPASLARVSQSVLVLSALTALLFASSAVRATYLPFSPCGRQLCFFGLLSFFFGFCLEAPQMLCLWMSGLVSAQNMLLSAAMGLTGLLGGLCAVCSVGDETEQTPPEETGLS